MNMKATLVSFSALAAVLMAGCSQEAKEDLSQAGNAAGTAVSKTGEAAATDAKKAGENVAAAGTAAVEATKDAAQNATEAAMSPKVKTALLNSAGLETKDINVETAHGTITLKGSVPDAKQKEQAGTVAKGIAGTEYKVDNQLAIKPA